MKTYYIVDEIWNHIKSYMIHNIRAHGKHLKIKNKNVCNYNQVVKSVPIIRAPRTGPRIIHSSAKNSFKTVKLLYHGIQLKNRGRQFPLYNTIIECVSLTPFLPGRFTLFGRRLTTNNTIKAYYYKNIQNAISKLA